MRVTRAAPRVSCANVLALGDFISHRPGCCAGRFDFHRAKADAAAYERAAAPLLAPAAKGRAAGCTLRHGSRLSTDGNDVGLTRVSTRRWRCRWRRRSRAAVWRVSSRAIVTARATTPSQQCSSAALRMVPRAAFCV
eukprot:356712-Chlamydomonas_euryale.AAC.12